MKHSEVIARVIYLANTANAEKHPPPRPPDVVPLVNLPEGETKLEAFLRGQTPDTIYLLAAVMHLGRGDFDSPDEMLASLQAMRALGEESWPIVEQLVEKLPLPEYLENGIKKLHARGLDVDTLMR
jgi:hypothetical protein